MIKLKDSWIAQILPKCFSEDAGVQALSFALYRAVERLIGYCGNISVFAVIDMAPDYVLDMLALDLNTQYYDDSLPVQSKRKLIKNTLVWYMSAGTPQSVEELVAAVFGEGKVEEWFEYGGKPYWFKIKTNAILTEDIISSFFNMLQKVKNTRSHIQSIEIHRIIDQSIVIKQGYYSVYKPVAIMQAITIHKTIDEKVYHGMQEMKVMHPTAIIMLKEQEE